MLRGAHPDVVEFEPEGASYQVGPDVRDRILPEASRAPIEGERKVVILFEADRLHGNQRRVGQHDAEDARGAAAAHGHPARDRAPDDLLDTIRSRCQRIDFAPLAEDVVRAALEREGVEPEEARLAAASRAGSSDGPATSPVRGGRVRDAFVTAAARLDGTAGSAERATDDLVGALADAVAELEERHAREAEELAAEIERAGYAAGRREP